MDDGWNDMTKELNKYCWQGAGRVAECCCWPLDCLCFHTHTHTHTHLSVEYIVGMRLLFINLGRDTVLLIPREVAKVTGLPLPWLLFVEVFLQDIFSFGK